MSWTLPQIYHIQDSIYPDPSMSRTTLPQIYHIQDSISPDPSLSRTTLPQIYHIQDSISPDSRAGLHDNDPADLLPRRHKVRQSRATQPRCIDVSDCMTTCAVQPNFWDSGSFNVKCHGRQLAPNRCTLGGGSVLDVVVQPGPACPEQCPQGGATRPSTSRTVSTRGCS